MNDVQIFTCARIQLHIVAEMTLLSSTAEPRQARALSIRNARLPVGRSFAMSRPLIVSHAWSRAANAATIVRWLSALAERARGSTCQRRPRRPSCRLRWADAL